MTISPARRLLSQSLMASLLCAIVAACSSQSDGGGGGGGGGGLPPATVPTVASVAVNPSSVTGGTAAQGTVTVSAAPTAGTAVALSSNNAAATVPATVTVNSGTTSATFNIATTAVPASTAVSILASLNSTSQSATLTLTPAAAPPPPPPVTFTAVVRVVSLSAAKRKQGNDVVEIPGKPAGSLNTCPLVQDGAGQRLDCEIDASASTSPNGISRYRYKWRLSTIDGDSGNIVDAKHRPAVQNCGFFGGQDSSNQQINMRVTVEITNPAGQVTSGVVEGVSVFPAGLCGYAF